MSQHREQRRHQALTKDLAEDKVADICRQLTCAKSWLYKWRNRYDATNPTWVQERSKRPQHHPTQTPEHVVQAVLSLYVTLRPHGTGSGAAAIREALTQQGRAPRPSQRTIYRLVHRYHKERTAHESHAASHS